VVYTEVHMGGKHQATTGGKHRAAIDTRVHLQLKQQRINYAQSSGCWNN
jgi:hypothetical protein